MKVIIDIPNWLYNAIMEHHEPVYSQSLGDAVRDGTPLPKRYGDLKDMANLQYVFDLTREDPIYSGKDIERAIKSMKSIIKADNTESE